jgi:predicted RNA-binding protein with PIN domain
MKQLIIDGYNLMFQAEPYLSLARAHEWDQARDALISDVASFALPQFQATVVFDGARNFEETREETQQLGVKILFSPIDTTADAVIERLVRRARKKGESVEVVSSDALVQWSTLGEGVIRRSAAEFAENLNFGYSEWERHRDEPVKRSTLESRITPAAAELLHRIRDEQDT